MYSLSPLLADNPLVSRLIAGHLVQMIPDGKKLEILVYKDNPDAMKLAKDLGLPDETQPHYQMFTKERFIVPVHKVYCLMAMSKFA